MKDIVVVTGANGHLGNTIIRMLLKTPVEIRGLVFTGEGSRAGSSLENVKDLLSAKDAAATLKYYAGDVRKTDTMRPLFERAPDQALYVIHAAGIVDISEHVSPLLYDTNVNGAKNVIALCKEYGAARLTYVSSVHAIPEGERLSVIAEVDRFSPDYVVGGYAKTKAEASQAVLDAAHGGLNAVIVHPSGILGPFDHSGNHLVQMVTDYLQGRLPACVKGGYDFVDVRDVAAGCLAAQGKGKSGECYILSNRHYELKDVLEMVARIAQLRRLPVLPMWLARAAAPLMQAVARRQHKRPLYTAYSLHTVQSNDRFSHDKATAELGYRPRDLRETMRDTVLYFRDETAPLPL